MESKDIAQILRDKDPEKYKLIIDRAEAGDYHDFTSLFATPKLQLAKDLDKYPELSHLRKAVVQGDFDE